MTDKSDGLHVDRVRQDFEDAAVDITRSPVKTVTYTRPVNPEEFRRTSDAFANTVQGLREHLKKPPQRG